MYCVSHHHGMQTGSVTISPAANTVTSKSVTFPKAYTKIPTVFVNARASRPDNVLNVTAVATLTGMTIYMLRSNTTDTVVDWLAAGEM